MSRPSRNRDELPLVARIVVDARTSLGGNQALADALTEVGVLYAGRPYTESTVSRWASGDIMPPADVLLTIAKVADQSLDDYLSSGDGRQIPVRLEDIDRLIERAVRRYPRRYSWRYESETVDSANSANPRTKPTYQRRFELIRLTVGGLLHTAVQLITQELAQSQPSLTLALHA